MQILVDIQNQLALLNTLNLLAGAILALTESKLLNV